MKTIQIEIRIDEKSNKMVTAWTSKDYSRDSLTHNLELLGIMENLKNTVQNKIKVLMEKQL